MPTDDFRMPRGFYRRECVYVSEIRGLRKGFLAFQEPDSK